MSEKTTKGEFRGITIAFIDLISKKTGLQFEYVEIPIERMSSISFLKEGSIDLVSGTLRTTEYLADPTLVVSDKTVDSTLAFVGKKGLDFSRQETVRVAISAGSHSCKQYMKKTFPDFVLLDQANSQSCLNAVYRGEADFAVINKYVAGYYLQKPQYERLSFLDSDAIKHDTCIITLKKNKAVIDLINKAILKISGNEYNSIMMHYIIATPYMMTLKDYLFKYKVLVMLIIVLLATINMIVFKLLAEHKIKTMLYCDSLTVSYTKYGFTLELKKALKKKNFQSYYLIDFDILGFDNFNSIYGREEGDILIIRMFDRIKNIMPQGSILVRIYADHGLVALPANNMHDIISHIAEIGGHIQTDIPDVSAFIRYGIYCIEDTKQSISIMIDRAIIARKNIKESTEVYYAVYDEELQKKLLADESVISTMNEALKNNDFFVLYQPKYDLSTKSTVGCEALIRWLKKSGEIGLPAEFIDIFEKNGQVIKLDFYLFDKICATQRKLIDKGLKPVVISANFSNINLYNQVFITNLLEVVKKHDLSPNLFQIELSESVMFYNRENVIEIVDKLRASGFSVAIDNFGSGYSSLNSLKDLQIDTLKLNRDFASNNQNVKDRQILQSLLDLADDLGISTVFEGIETIEHLQFVKECNGCDTVQGNYFSHLLTQDEYIQFIAQNTSKCNSISC